jgi:two-component system, OmpR family, response regulator MtrA
MPSLDGLGVLRALRDDEATRNLPVVMMTTSPGMSASDRSAIDQLGASVLLHKPSSAEELAELIGHGLTEGGRVSKRVLVVEDEEDIRRLVSIKLKGAGYEVSTAHDGEEGLAAAVRDKPDLLVSDVMMPKKDGYTMGREVREALGSEAPVVIMLTSRGQDTDVATGLDSGADDYIVKPFAPRELIARIQVVMLRHERQRGE